MTQKRKVNSARGKGGDEPGSVRPSPLRQSGTELIRELFEPSDLDSSGALQPFEQPSDDAIERFASVPLAIYPQRQRREFAGKLVFDSWTDRSVMELRDGSVGQTRRICFKSREVELDMLAERTRDGWKFVARVYKSGEVSSEHVLRVGRRRILPKTQGFFHWSSRSTPGTLGVDGPDVRLNFEGMKWS